MIPFWKHVQHTLPKYKMEPSRAQITRMKCLMPSGKRPYGLFIKEMPENLLIIGSGALACLFAARLSRSGQPVTLTGTWKAGLDAIRKNGVGLVEVDKPQPVFYPVDVLNPEISDQRFSHALILTKAYQTGEAVRRVKPHLSSDCFGFVSSEWINGTHGS